LSKIVYFLVVSLSLTACGQSQQSQIPVLDSGYALQHAGGAERTFWLDNERVLFAGAVLARFQKSQSEFIGVHVWDTKRNTVVEIRPRGGWLCYYEGKIYYSYYDGEPPNHKWTVGEGTLTEILERAYFSPQSGVDPSQALCDQTLFSRKLNPDNGHVRVNLLKNHGYLDLGPAPLLHDSRQIQFFARGGAEPIALPLKNWQIESYRTSFAEFANVYLLFGDRPTPNSVHTEWPKGFPHPIYLLLPDGIVKTIQIPYSRLLDNVGTRFYLTKRGVLAVSEDRSQLGDIRGGAAAYLVEDEKITKVWERLLGGYSVSPDGCKFVARASARGENTATLRMINLCSNGQ
jgi:hypothetical protein